MRVSLTGGDPVRISDTDDIYILDPKCTQDLLRPVPPRGYPTDIPRERHSRKTGAAAIKRAAKKARRK